MSKKSILIIVIIVVMVVVGFIIFRKDLGCVASGGKVITENCCLGSSNFLDNCKIGACGCSPENSKPIKTCQCKSGCWGGSTCLPR